MGDSGMGEPMARAEGLGLGQLPPFLRQKAQAWKRDTAAAAEDDWGPHPIDSMVGFAHAVEWTEPWIVGLLAMHVFLLLAAIVTRHSFEAQVGLFLLTLGLTASAEWLNAWGAAHWQEFASQDYFDEHGVFASVVFCAPLLLVAFVILVLSLRSTVQMMVVTKRHELQRSIRAKKENKGRTEQEEEKEEQGSGGQPPAAAAPSGTTEASGAGKGAVGTADRGRGRGVTARAAAAGDKKGPSTRRRKKPD